MSVSGHPSLEELLAEAGEKTSKYEWMDAATLYQRALENLRAENNTLEAARLTELLARCYFKGAFQSESREEFKRVMPLAEDSYQRAADLYERAGSDALSKRTDARCLFASFWVEDDPEERRGIIGRTISLAEEAAQTFERQGDKKSLAESHRDILSHLFESWWLAREWAVLKEQFEQAFSIGQKAIGEFELLGDSEGLLESLYFTITFLIGSTGVVEPLRYGKLAKKAEGLTTRMSEISAKIGTPYALSLAEAVAWWQNTNIEGDYAKALDAAEAGISKAESIKDSYLTGLLAACVVSSAGSAGEGEEDVERRRELFEKGIRFWPIGIKNLEIPSHGGALNWVYQQCAERYIDLARFVETDAEKKRTHLRKAIEIARKGYTYKDYASGGGHSLSKAMYFLAVLDIDPEEKAQLFKEALLTREEAVRETVLLVPRSFELGANRNYLALIKAELAKIAHDPKTRIELLQGAVSDMQKCVELCAEWTITPESFFALSWYEEWFGDILLQLYSLSREPGTGQLAIKVYGGAIEHLSKSGHTGSLAPVRWKIAKVYDAMGEYKEASQAFRSAGEDYRHGAKKVPGLSSVFGELASYVDAWSLIEQARLHHNDEQYLLAAENYTKAASTLQQTRSWSRLSKHYTACSFLEGGEALSRQEREEPSIESFSAAVKAFQEAKAELEDKLRQNPEPQESLELNNWLQITNGRERYCLGRIELEEAKLLNKKGEEEASSAKYRSASEIFSELLREAPNPQSRREMETLTLFSEAWARMKEAEAKASPELYAEAAEAFMKAKEASTKKRARLMAMANASICRALESGALFRRTRSTQSYSEIKRHLEAATDYYHEGGFDNAADWTRATQRLFDAQAYLAGAETEMDSKRKTELYHLAEKHLQLAAKTYGEAGFPTKRGEALKHLRRAREEKELLLTPIEALAENPAVTGVAVMPVSLIRDQAVGLERFEVANVVGNLSVAQRDLSVGSDLTIELEMANVGKTAATLIKLENIAPEGLEIDRTKVPHRVEDNYLDMKGKRLEYLKTHEVKIPMRAVRKGAFELRPRILFVDEKGNYRSYEFEPVSLTVRELGISGWIKGR